MSEPDSPRWLDQWSDELRGEAPVRPEWRARLLDDIARAPRPSRTDGTDVRFDVDEHDESLSPATRARRRSIVLSPMAGLAAALAFVVVGAAVTYALLGGRSGAADHMAAIGPSSVARTVADGARGVQEPVQFELIAPSASRVTLVGSFNEWNPAATPLIRDATTGKWTVSIRLAPGRHVYAFVVDGDVTPDPTAPRAADADFGAPNSVVFVQPPRT